MSLEQHDAQATEVIAAELVACTLGARRHPELLTDLTGAMARLVQGMARIFRNFEGTRG